MIKILINSSLTTNNWFIPFQMVLFLNHQLESHNIFRDSEYNIYKYIIFNVSKLEMY